MGSVYPFLEVSLPLPAGKIHPYLSTQLEAEEAAGVTQQNLPFLSPPVPLPTMTQQKRHEGTWKPRLSFPKAPPLPSARLENGSGMGGREGQGVSRRVSGPPPGCPQAGVSPDRIHAPHGSREQASP